MDEECTLFDYMLLNLLRFVLWLFNICSILGGGSMCTWEEDLLCCCWLKCVTFNCFTEFKFSTSLLILCQVVLSITESGLLKFPNIIVELSIFPFTLRIIFHVWGDSLVRRIMFIIVLSSWWIVPFIIMPPLFLSLGTNFVFKSILLDTDVATPAFFRMPFARCIFFYFFYFPLYLWI